MIADTRLRQQESTGSPTRPAAGLDAPAITKAAGPVDGWLFQGIVEQLPLAVTVLWAETDEPLDMQVVYSGPHSAVITDTDMSQRVGRRFRDAFPNLCHTDLPDRLFTVATGTRPDHIGVVRYANRQVPERWFRLEAQPLGRRCVLVVYTNVTEQQRATQSLRQQRREATALAEIGRIISASLDIQDVYAALATSVRQLIPYDQLAIGTVDLTADTITNVYNSGHELSPARAIGQPYPLRGVATERVVRTRQAELLQAETDEALLARYPQLRGGVSRGLRSTITVPLIARDEVVGVLTMRSARANAYTTRHLALAEQVGLEIAGAIANAWAYAALKETEAAEAVLAEIGRIISSVLDIGQVYGQLADCVRRLIPYDRLAIATVDLAQHTITSVYNTAVPITPRWAIGRTNPLAGTATANVVRTRQPLLMQAATDAALAAQFPGAREGLEQGMRSTVVVPLIARDEVVGVLTIRSTQANAFTQRHLALADQVANQIAGAIANAWAYATLKESKETEAALLRSNTDLEQFAYAVSHDLQEPLRVVASYVQLLSHRYGGRLDARADRYISRSLAGVASMRTLIKDLLTYARVGTHQLELTATPTEAVVAEVLDRLAVSVRENAAEITWDPLPTVQADAVQVTQLFQNLLGNALKYRSTQPPRIHIAVERHGQRWQFAVRDNGIGIDPAYAAQIFLVFQRLHTRERYSGTGIGLALCQKIVERHGGKITVESQLGQGATFTFTLPAAAGIAAGTAPL